MPIVRMKLLRFNVFALVFSVLCVLLASPLPALAQSRGTPDSFADLAEKLLPSVVNISTTQKITARDNDEALPDMPQFPPGSPFEEFFQDFFERHGGGKNGGGNNLPPRKAMSLGSGFIIDAGGYIVTNNHVIQDADEITVILHDDTNLKAELVGRDQKTDLALLKVKPTKPLTAVSFGDSDAIRVGDWVLAIGNPFGLGGTVTAGIISARARDINSGPYDDYLQTDAPINRGNSGGPMFNLKGEVIGINTAIFSPTGGSIGIGFAIPSNISKPVLAQLQQFGRTKRGWLGVRIQMVTEDIAQSLGLEKAKGALVSSITDGGPAVKAGLKPGDVILSFNGKEVSEMRRLPLMVAETPVDTSVPLTVWRKGKIENLTVKIGELENAEDKGLVPVAEAKAEVEPKAETVKPLGVGVAAITNDLRDKFDINQDVKGVVVLSVDANGLAADKGIKAGDVIVEADQATVESVDALRSRVDAAVGRASKPLLLLIDRNGDLRFVAFSIEKVQKDSNAKEGAAKDSSRSSKKEEKKKE